MPSYLMDLSLRFEAHSAGADEEAWSARCTTVPDANARGATQEAAVRAAASLALRVIAELIAKGDRRWARFKEVKT